MTIGGTILDGMIYVQRSMSGAQAVLLIGPAIVSPCKAVISVAEIVAGVACAVVFGIIGTLVEVCCGREYSAKLYDVVNNGGEHILVGAVALAYSVANIVTLGFFGALVEGCLRDSTLGAAVLFGAALISLGA